MPMILFSCIDVCLSTKVSKVMEINVKFSVSANIDSNNFRMIR